MIPARQPASLRTMGRPIGSRASLRRGLPGLSQRIDERQGAHGQVLGAAERRPAGTACGGTAGISRAGSERPLSLPGDGGRAQLRGQGGHHPLAAGLRPSLLIGSKGGRWPEACNCGSAPCHCSWPWTWAGRSGSPREPWPRCCSTVRTRRGGSGDRPRAGHESTSRTAEAP